MLPTAGIALRQRQWLSMKMEADYDMVQEVDGCFINLVDY